MNEQIAVDGQDFGSLYDLLHNETVPIERDTMVQLCRDISQGTSTGSFSFAWNYFYIQDLLACQILLLQSLM